MAPAAVETDVVVIGAGPGGYAAAFRAADRGLNVTLVDPEANPGGVCLYRGCIPSKAYLHVARLLRETEEARAWGVEFERPRIDVDALRAWKDKVVGQMTGGLASLCKAKGVGFVRGRASFRDARTLAIDGVEPTSTVLGFQHAVIATGSRPAVIPDLLPDSPRVQCFKGLAT